jgi:predicted ATPase
VAPVADRLFAETDGNPSFLQELTRGLIESGQIHVDAGQWSGPFVEATAAAEVALPEIGISPIVFRMVAASG